MGNSITQDQWEIKKKGGCRLEGHTKDLWNMRMEEMSRRQRRMEGLSDGGQGTTDGKGLLIVMNR